MAWSHSARAQIARLPHTRAGRRAASNIRARSARAVRAACGSCRSFAPDEGRDAKPRAPKEHVWVTRARPNQDFCRMKRAAQSPVFSGKTCGRRAPGPMFYDVFVEDVSRGLNNTDPEVCFLTPRLPRRRCENIGFGARLPNVCPKTQGFCVAHLI